MYTRYGLDIGRKGITGLTCIILVIATLSLALGRESKGNAYCPAKVASQDNDRSHKKPTDLKDHDSDLVKAVMEALDVVKKGSPQVHEDALRVWKNFKATSNPKYTYRYWGRHIISWLKDEKKIVINSLAKCEEVFDILWQKGLISKEAARVLGLDAWSQVAYLEGVPGFDQRKENLMKNRDAGNLDGTEKRGRPEIFL